MKREEWKRHVEAQRRSGKSVVEYCRDAGLAENTFRYHQKRPAGKFVQVSGREPIEVLLPSGVLLRVPSSEVSSVLKVLSGE